jgi:pyrimidine operon attenuation protein/uracil phosphoribosyltransferase
MDFSTIERSLERIAHEIIEGNRDMGFVLVGIYTRGVYLAQRISRNIAKHEDYRIPVGKLDPILYRDDQKPQILSSMKSNQLDCDINEKTIILVDDVLYTGRTIRASMEALLSYGRAKVVQVAVLVDRGHRELPVRADYVGKNIPTTKDEKVKVKVKEFDGVDQVELLSESGSIKDQK